MSTAPTPNQPEPSNWPNIIGSIKTPMGFFALVLLVLTAAFTIATQRAEGVNLTILIVGMLVIFALVILLVASQAILLREKRDAAVLKQELSRTQELAVAPLREAGPERDSKADAYQYDVFLATPMAAFRNDEEFKAQRKEMMKVFNALTAKGLRVFWAAQNIQSMEDFNLVGAAADMDLRAMRASHSFMLLYLQKLPTSALFEAGYAFALGMPSLYIAHSDDLPFMMKDMVVNYPSRVHLYDETQWNRRPGATLFDKISEMLEHYSWEELSFFARHPPEPGTPGLAPPPGEKQAA